MNNISIIGPGLLGGSVALASKKFELADRISLWVRRPAAVEELMDANKAERNNASENWKGDFHKVASIPMTIIIEWSKEVGGGMNILKPENKKKFVAKLNDPDFVNLRTKLGNI